MTQTTTHEREQLEHDRAPLVMIQPAPYNAEAPDSAVEILLAYDMNGAPLNADHGAPLRLIVPNWYGVASVKWLTHIHVSATPLQHEFQTGHYMYEWADRPHEPVTVMRVRARITDP